MAEGAGVPSAGVASAAGVAAFESEALSPFELLAGGCEPVAETVSAAGELMFSFSDLTGESSLMGLESTSSRSLSGDTLRVTSSVGFALDLRRASADLA